MFKNGHTSKIFNIMHEILENYIINRLWYSTFLQKYQLLNNLKEKRLSNLANSEVLLKYDKSVAN